MSAREIVGFKSLMSVRKKNYFASKERGLGKKARHQPSGHTCLVRVLCILQILLAGNRFISPLAGSAAAVLTDTGWPLQTRLQGSGCWDTGNLADEPARPTQVLCKSQL